MRQVIQPHISKTIKKGIFFLCGYILLSLVIGLFFTAITVLTIYTQNFKFTSVSSVSARVVITPLTILFPERFFPTMHLWNSGLKILDLSPKFLTTFESGFSDFSQNASLSLTTRNDAQKVSSLACAEIYKIKKNSERSFLIAVLKKERVDNIEANLELTEKLCVFSQLVFQNYEVLTGNEEEKNYLILFQNDRELRPTGGFLGSYAWVTFYKGQMTHFEVQDIYVPDGQLGGHVNPPLPIQEAFQQGFWKLRDANWHPDAIKSAENIEWFFEQSGSKKIDGTIYISYHSIEKIFEQIGDIYLPDYGETIKPEELYTFLQTEVEKDFFPGSTKKQNILSSISAQFFQNIQQLSIEKKLSLIKVLDQQLNEKFILFTVKNDVIHQYLNDQHWSGQFTNIPCQSENCLNDFFSIIDANLGVNKANCCVERVVNITKNLNQTDQKMNTVVQLEYTLTEPKEELKKFAGAYKAFVRVYLPTGTTSKKIMLNGQTYDDFIQKGIEASWFYPKTNIHPTQDDFDQLSEYGFWIYVQSNEKLIVDIEFETPLPSAETYQLFIRKQPATLDAYNNWTVKINGKTHFENILQQDKIVTPSL